MGEVLGSLGHQHDDVRPAGGRAGDEHVPGQVQDLGAVNGTGSLVAGGAAVLRRLQTGSVRTYAGSLFLGVVVVLGYYLWR